MIRKSPFKNDVTDVFSIIFKSSAFEFSQHYSFSLSRIPCLCTSLRHSDVSCAEYIFFTTLLHPQLLSDAQHEPGFCAFYEECGRNPQIEGALINATVPCLDYSPARSLSWPHYDQLRKVWRSPSLCQRLKTMGRFLS